MCFSLYVVVFHGPLFRDRKEMKCILWIKDPQVIELCEEEGAVLIHKWHDGTKASWEVCAKTYCTGNEVDFESHTVEA